MIHKYISSLAKSYNRLKIHHRFSSLVAGW